MCEGALYRKKTGYVARTIAGETILVPVRASVGEVDAIFNLNEVGAFIWERLDGQTSEGQIVEAMLEEFDVTPDQAGQDTATFLSRLETAGIIERNGNGV